MSNYLHHEFQVGGWGGKGGDRLAKQDGSGRERGRQRQDKKLEEIERREREEGEGRRRKRYVLLM